MRISLLEVQNLVLLISTKRLHENDDSEAVTAFSKFATFWFAIGLSETFPITIRVGQNDDL